VTGRTYRWEPNLANDNTNTGLIEDGMLQVGLHTAFSSVVSTDAVQEGSSYTLDPNDSRVATDYRGGFLQGCSGGVGLLPKQTAGLITFQSGVSGGQGQGRMYIPFPSPLASKASGAPTDAYLLLMTTLASALLGPIPTKGVSGAIGQLVAVTKPYNDFTPVTQFTSSKPSPAWATQRRRGDYGRLNKSPFHTSPAQQPALVLS
jgi:hypothetical protein